MFTQENKNTSGFFLTWSQKLRCPVPLNQLWSNWRETDNTVSKELSDENHTIIPVTDTTG